MGWNEAEILLVSCDIHSDAKLDVKQLAKMVSSAAPH